MRENQPRKSHLIPAFFLAGFTHDGSRDSRLHVFDQERERRYQGRPDELATMTDAYQIDSETVGPFELEDALGRLETVAAPVIARLLAHPTELDTAGRNALVPFMAALAARTIKRREHVDRVFSEMGLRFADAMVAAGKLKLPPRPPELGDPDRPLSEILQMKLSSTAHADIIGTLTSTISPWLQERRWTVLVANGGEGDFVCSDHPLALKWADGDRGFYDPGFGVPGTVVTVPIGRRVALLAQFEGDGGVLPVYRRTVAAINTNTISCGLAIYSAQGDFRWFNKAGAVADSDELMTVLQSKVKDGRRTA